ncbi:MAG: DUF1542 domain-containing protein [Tannerella sp.]|jgi:hypothetical protein|nr:DUF1542 domain-containing protein [Tannerella sp.]
MDFTERFNSYSNSQLLGIIENPNDYQPEAVETAKAIISHRQLTDNELEIAKNELDAEKQKIISKEQQEKEMYEELKNFGESVLENISPVQRKSFNANKTIKIISILLGVMFLFRLYSEFKMIRFIFTDYATEWDLSMVFNYLPLLILAISAILFWMKKKAGWILAGVSLTHDAFGAIQMFYILWSRQSKEPNLLIDFMLPSVPPVYHIGAFLFFMGMIIVICRKNIRAIFSVEKLTMILTIALTVLIIWLTIYLVS